MTTLFKDEKNAGFLRVFARTGLMLVIVAAVTLEATSLIQYYYSQKGLREESIKRADAQLEAAENRILDIIDQAETAVRNSVWVARWCLERPDSLMSVARRIVQDNPVIMGSTVAMVPGYLPGRPLFSPYVFSDAEGLHFGSLATPEYDYPSHEWFQKPIELGEGYWSEPYVDEGGGGVLMTTYSLPVVDRFGKIAAVITADLSLEWLSEMMDHVKTYPGAFGMIISRTGQIMACPVDSMIMRHNVNDSNIFAKGDDTVSLRKVNNAMLSGQSGSMTVNLRGKKSAVFFDPVERTGWAMSIVVPESEIYGGLKRTGFVVMIFQILGLLMLIFILYTFIKGELRFRALNEKRERFMGELQIASNIQMSMVPKKFPPFPERHDLDLSATIVPAKEVGGDLYDFFIRDDKLFFCIGDVSGKGVPASLVMAVTRATFRSVAAHEDSPGKIVRTMNNGMCEMNESEMFVTFFCGVLDLANGHLRYCNAGHNPPMVLTNVIEMLPVEPNLPLGILPDTDFKEQKMPFRYDDALFLYTDGLTEAENAEHEQFGEERAMAALHGRRSAQAHMENIKQKVADFVGDAPQSDDLTMLFLHFLGQGEDVITGRRLIIHNDIAQISKLPGWIDALAEEFGIDAHVALSLNLAIEEAVTNVILYAYPPGFYGSVEILADYNGNALAFTLVDSGKPFDPTAKPPVDTTASLEDRAIGGLGIHLVRKIMDQVSYRREEGCNVLTMIKNI